MDVEVRGQPVLWAAAFGLVASVPENFRCCGGTRGAWILHLPLRFAQSSVQNDTRDPCTCSQCVSALELEFGCEFDHTSLIAAGGEAEVRVFNGGFVRAEGKWLQIRGVEDVVEVCLEADVGFPSKRIKVDLFGKAHIGVDVAGT